MVAANLSSRKGLRNDFKAELARILAELKICEEIDKELSSVISDQRIPMIGIPGKKTWAGGKGSQSAYIRLTEQRLANRRDKAGLIKLLWDVKRNVLDRDLKIAVAELKAEMELRQEARDSAVTAEVLAFLQSERGGLMRPSLTLEPGEWMEAEEIPSLPAPPVLQAAKDSPQEEDARWPGDLPEDVSPGDLVSDPSGSLWIVGEDDRHEPADARAEELFLSHPSGAPPFARLADGRLVLVFEVDA